MAIHIYYSVPNERSRFVELPKCYLGFASAEDAEQIAAGLRRTQKKEPGVSAVKRSLINLARKRKGGGYG